MRECGIGILPLLEAPLAGAREGEAEGGGARTHAPRARAPAEAPGPIPAARGAALFAAGKESAAGGPALTGAPSPAASAGRAPAPPSPRRRYNLIFLGDSLVTGVGCSSADGPAFPRAVASRLAQLLGVDVRWQCHGVNGGDTRMIEEHVDKILGGGGTPRAGDASASAEAVMVTRASLRAGLRPDGGVAGDAEGLRLVARVPALTSPQEATRSLAERIRAASVDGAGTSGGGPADDTEEFTAVVLLVGLNEWKQMWRGMKTPWAFRDDLAALIQRIRERVGNAGASGNVKVRARRAASRALHCRERASL